MARAKKKKTSPIASKIRKTVSAPASPELTGNKKHVSDKGGVTGAKKVGNKKGVNAKTLSEKLGQVKASQSSNYNHGNGKNKESARSSDHDKDNGQNSSVNADEEMNNTCVNATSSDASIVSDSSDDLVVFKDTHNNIASIVADSVNMDSKAKLREEIAQLEALLHEEEDEELQLLKKKKETLQKVLNKKLGATGHSKKLSKDRIHVEDNVFVNKFDELTKGKLPSLSQIQNVLNVTEKKGAKVKKQRKVKRTKKRVETTSSSSSSDSSSDVTSDEGDSDDEATPKKRKGKKLKSGLFAKADNAQLVSSELFAQAALDTSISKNLDLDDLSFNLLVAGELEIITSKHIKSDEQFSRLQLLKMLAYKAEHLQDTEILKQYGAFVNKVEKGIFKWGSKRDLRLFEHQLLYSITIEGKKKVNNNFGSVNVDKLSKQKKFEEQKKYCLDFNRGNCKYEKAHEGKISGQVVWKSHICKRCLMEEGIEAQHAEKDCTKAK